MLVVVHDVYLSPLWYKDRWFRSVFMFLNFLPQRLHCCWFTVAVAGKDE